MVNKNLLDLLKKFQVDRDFSTEIREGYRNPLEENITSYLTEKPNYRYGGSLAKGTANTNSCDIDLLCYMDSDSLYSVHEVYEEIANSLESNNFIIEKKIVLFAFMAKMVNQNGTPLLMWFRENIPLMILTKMCFYGVIKIKSV